MFDIGGWEFVLIVILGILVIGPKELPGAIRTVSMFMRRAREMARDFQAGLEEMAREAELDKMKDEINRAVDPDGTIGGIRSDLENTIDPDNEIRHAMDYSREWTEDDLMDHPGNSPDVASAGNAGPDAADGGEGREAAPPNTAAPATAPEGSPDSGEPAVDEEAVKRT